jgi:hypothetical protein
MSYSFYYGKEKTYVYSRHIQGILIPAVNISGYYHIGHDMNGQMLGLCWFINAFFGCGPICFHCQYAIKDLSNRTVEAVVDKMVCQDSKVPEIVRIISDYADIKETRTFFSDARLADIRVDPTDVWPDPVVIEIHKNNWMLH